MSRSLVAYIGPSAYLPRTLIRAVVVPSSENRKTGDVAQLYILPHDVSPHTAQITGQDAAVCGLCPLRPAIRGGCYVVPFRGPLSAWKATRRAPVAGAAALACALRGRALRLGAYGDPAALPAHVIDPLATLTGGNVTGYTHGWRSAPHLRRWCMASVESPTDAVIAWDQGWRTFRITAGNWPSSPPSAEPGRREITCPSVTHGIECRACRLCSGSQRRAASITIPAHGVTVRKALAVVG